MNTIQLRSEDLDNGTLKLVESETGEIVAEDAQGIQFQIAGDPEEVEGDGFVPGGMLSSSF